MAETKRVEVYIPRAGAHEDPNFFVSVNGKNYLLPKGQTSAVPPEVKEEIERSMRAQNLMDENIDARKN